MGVYTGSFGPVLPRQSDKLGRAMAADDIPQVGRCRWSPYEDDADMVHRRIVMLTVAGDHPPTVVRRFNIIGSMPRPRRPTSPARDSSDVRNGPRLTDGCSDRHTFAGSPEDAEDLGGFVAGAAEPVRHLGIECGHFAGRRL